MRRSRATPYAETAALQASTATKPRKTLVAMERRIDLHSSAHAPGPALSCSRRRLRRFGLAGPRRGARGGPALRRAGGPGSGASGRRLRGRPGSRGDDDARRFDAYGAGAGLRAAAQALGSADCAHASLACRFSDITRRWIARGSSCSRREPRRCCRRPSWSTTAPNPGSGTTQRTDTFQPGRGPGGRARALGAQSRRGDARDGPAAASRHRRRARRGGGRSGALSRCRRRRRPRLSGRLGAGRRSHWPARSPGRSPATLRLPLCSPAPSGRGLTRAATSPAPRVPPSPPRGRWGLCHLTPPLSSRSSRRSWTAPSAIQACAVFRARLHGAGISACP